MSTKTNFKRIALVAVAAMGIGTLSSVPAKAVFNSLPTLAVTNGTATKAKSDSTTAGTVAVRFLATANTDTVTITAALKSAPSYTVTPRLNMNFGDTATSVIAQGIPNSLTPAGESVSVGASAQITSEADISIVPAVATGGYVGLTMKAFLDTTVARVVGTYTFTITITPYTQVGAGAAGHVLASTNADLSITVAALDSESTVASAGSSAAYLHSAASGTPTADISSTVLATASTTERAWLYVNLVNAGGGQASESVTITTTVGNFGPSGGVATGKQLTVAYASGGAKYYPIFADGTAGTAVITVKSGTVTFANKSLVFYAANPTTLVAKALNTTPGVGTNSSAVEVVAKDANGILWGGSLAIYSDTLGTISDTGTACTNANTTVGAFLCPVTGVVAGTAKVKVYASAQTMTSNEISLTISQATPATVKLSWNKATYAPGEKATLSVEVLDSAGKAVPNGTFANLFATGGISLSIAAGNGSDTVTSVSATTSTTAQDYVGTSTTGAKAYTVYMPASGGTITASATGGTSLPTAGQVKVTATATVTDSGAAALAAVNALATTVASLRTLITTLTNLVLKIQKKVKA